MNPPINNNNPVLPGYWAAVRQTPPTGPFGYYPQSSNHVTPQVTSGPGGTTNPAYLPTTGHAQFASPIIANHAPPVQPANNQMPAPVIHPAKPMIFQHTQQPPPPHPHNMNTYPTLTEATTDIHAYPIQHNTVPKRVD